jgi:hypothetical protein
MFQKTFQTPNHIQFDLIGRMISTACERIDSCKLKTIFDFDFSITDRETKKINKFECFLGIQKVETDDVVASMIFEYRMSTDEYG